MILPLPPPLSPTGTASSSHQVSEPICCHKLIPPRPIHISCDLHRSNHPTIKLPPVPTSHPAYKSPLLTKPISHRWNGHQRVILKTNLLDHSPDAISLQASRFPVVGQIAWSSYQSRNLVLLTIDIVPTCQIIWINTLASSKFHKINECFLSSCLSSQLLPGSGVEWQDPW